MELNAPLSPSNFLTYECHVSQREAKKIGMVHSFKVKDAGERPYMASFTDSWSSITTTFTPEEQRTSSKDGHSQRN